MLRRNPVIEIIADDMAEVLRRKSGLERLAIADDIYRGARELIETSVRERHPDWEEDDVRKAVSRRIAGASV